MTFLLHTDKIRLRAASAEEALVIQQGAAKPALTIMEEALNKSFLPAGHSQIWGKTAPHLSSLVGFMYPDSVQPGFLQCFWAFLILAM